MKIRLSYKYAIFALVILLFGKLTETNVLFPKHAALYVRNFQLVFSQKEKECNKILADLSGALTKTKHSLHSFDPFLTNYSQQLQDKDGLSIFIYENDSLKFWSDNSIPVHYRFSKNGFDNSIVNLPNGWYFPKTVRMSRFTLVSLVKVKQTYPYENKYLSTRFEKDFDIPASTKVSEKAVAGSSPIIDLHGKYLFSLVFDKNINNSLYQTYIPSASYLLAILLFLLFFYHFIKEANSNAKRNKTFLLVVAGIFAIRLLMLQYKLPAAFYELDLFKPQSFALSSIAASLGDLLLWAITIFSVVFMFYKHFFITIPEGRNRNQKLHLPLVMHLSLILGAFTCIIFLIKAIILNSTVSFEINKLLLFDLHSFAGYLVIILLLVSFAFYVDKILCIVRQHNSYRTLTIIMLMVSVVWGVIWMLTLGSAHAFTWLFIVVLGLVMSYVRVKQNSIYNFSVLTVLTFLFAIYTVFIVSKYSFERDFNQKKVIITNLANEHDPVAEFLLQDINDEIVADTMLIRLVHAKNPDFKRIYDRLKHYYFDDYFKKYSLEQIPICEPDDSLYLEPPDNSYSPCYKFFQSMIKDRGTKLSETNFYYVDNLNGYLGWFEFKSPQWTSPVSLFIELSLKLEKSGYPELLLDSRFSSRSKANSYSYAKYYKGQMVSKNGNFSYNLSANVFGDSRTNYSVTRIDNEEHLVYWPSKESLIVLSTPATTFIDLLVAFSYTFVVYFMMLTLVVLIINLPIIKSILLPNFKNKIQFSMMSLLFLSLILIGGGTLLFNIRQNYNKNNMIISEKIQSIYFELSLNLAQERRIAPNNNLNDLLWNLSNIFYSDINLYGTEGNLIASSRPELYSKGLVGTMINPKAYNALAGAMKAEVITSEKIGRLNYISAYVPFYNKDDKLLGYLNLPYFTRQEEFTREISTMIVAVVNIYVILLLITFVIAVFISRKITLPLRLIQMKFSEIKLGQQYEKIDHDSNDEIGGLVNEYNRMVTELEKSVELLAKSERESAWREMAKQIAHEINNPLTPMKLSVQHLQRAWNDKNERFGEYLERISKTLIEEIDNLSSIATEFSSFAKMPKADNHRLDLVTKISNIADLFSTENAEFKIKLNGLTEVPVYADKEQISRVFINLFKNAIQSVEKGIKPLVMIDISVNNSTSIIRIHDNGKGISHEAREKLFSPNFTTKTSGMGLGLAIVKSIVESSGGSITYETQENKGTTFIITLPLHK